MKFLKTLLLLTLIAFTYSARNLKNEENSEVKNKSEDKTNTNINSQKTKTNNSKGKRRDDVDGGNSNTPDDKGQEAIAFNYTPNPGKDVKYDQFNGIVPSGYKKPTIVDNLPPATDSKYYERKIEEIPETRNNEKEQYYNGDERLNIKDEDCEKFNNDEKSCMNNAHCGFCDDNKSCLAGNKHGAFKSCKNYRFFNMN